MNSSGWHLATVLLLIGGLLTTAGFSQSYDARVNQVISVTLTDTNNNALSLGAGGRVGNWFPSANGGTLILDLNVNGINNQNHVTTLYTAQMPSSFTGSTLNLPVTPLLSQAQQNQLVAGAYQGNRWVCPGGDVILFQASVTAGGSGAYAPGAGADNNVWVLRVSDGSLTKITSVVTHVGSVGNGVLGPQCSQDSQGPPNNVYHIVYGYLNELTGLLLPNVGVANCNNVGYSNGKCGWYGDWSLVFEDITFPGGALTVSNQTVVKPRSIVGNPFGEVSSGSGSIGTNMSAKTVVSSQLSGAMAGSGITVTDGSNVVQTSIVSTTTNMGVTTATLAYGTGLTNNDPCTFSVYHNVYYEPNWYPVHWNLTGNSTTPGQLYYTSNRHLTWHDSVNVLGTFLGTASSPTVTLTELTPEPATANSYSTTVFGEFITPSPNYPAGKPFALYMSDKAHIGASGCATALPECSDLYICTLPNCANQIPVVIPKATEMAPDYTVTRFGWSPIDNTHLASLLQINGSSPQFYIWNLKYPTLESVGNVQTKGRVTMK